jgi:hypothetical protein
MDTFLSKPISIFKINCWSTKRSTAPLDDICVCKSNWLHAAESFLRSWQSSSGQEIARKFVTIFIRDPIWSYFIYLFICLFRSWDYSLYRRMMGTIWNGYAKKRSRSNSRYSLNYCLVGLRNATNHCSQDSRFRVQNLNSASRLGHNIRSDPILSHRHPALNLTLYLFTINFNIILIYVHIFLPYRTDWFFRYSGVLKFLIIGEACLLNWERARGNLHAFIIHPALSSWSLGYSQCSCVYI